MSIYCFQVDAAEFCKAARSSTLKQVSEYDVFLQVHEDALRMDILMPFPGGAAEDYDVHASSQVAVGKYMNSESLGCEETKLMKIMNRDGYNKCYQEIRNLPAGASVVLYVRNNNPEELLDSIQFATKTNGVEKVLPQIGVEEHDGSVWGPENYAEINEEAEVRYDAESPEEILFYSRRVPGYWITTTLNEAGSIKELTTIRAAIESEHAPTIEGDTYIMPKARRGRKQATVPAGTPESTDTAAGGNTAPPPVIAPVCVACGDTGKNSKGDTCVCRKVNTPAVTKAPTPPPIVEKPPATTQPPLASPEAGTQENAPVTEPTTDTPTPKGGTEKKPPARRTKEEIRLDKIEKSFKLLTDEQEAEDVVDGLVEFCKGILGSKGYTVEKGASTDEALTLQETLGALGDDIGNAIGKLTRTKDRILAAQASSEGLTTKEELLAKLAAAL